MTTQLEPTKGAGTTLWIYTGSGDPYANPLSDQDWTRLAKIKELTPGEMTAESYDDTYLDDADADWNGTAQGAKSSGDTSFTLAWKPGESGQQDLVNWFYDGAVRGYKIRYPNTAVDVFRGWISSLGKAVPVKEVITRTVKITNTGKPALAESNQAAAVPVSGVTVTPSAASVVVGQNSVIGVTVLPDGATNGSFSAASSDLTVATITVSGKNVSAKGVKAGTAQIIIMTNEGQKVAICNLTVTAA